MGTTRFGLFVVVCLAALASAAGRVAGAPATSRAVCSPFAADGSLRPGLRAIDRCTDCRARQQRRGASARRVELRQDDAFRRGPPSLDLTAEVR